MGTWAEVTASVVFLGVLALIATERMHLTIAAFLGAMLLVFFMCSPSTKLLATLAKAMPPWRCFLG